MSDVRHYNAFLEMVTTVLKERALKAAAERKAAARNSRTYNFKEGESLAFYSAITLLKQQAEAMDIPLPALDSLNPDRDLL